MTTGIYKYQNKINGRIYIGQSQNIETRYQQHLYDSSARTQEADNEEEESIDAAIKRLGINNFIFSIVEECSIDELDEKEIYWIKYYDSYHNGYNKTPGGKAVRGEEHPRAILNEKQVWEIREMYKNHIKRSDVFNKFKTLELQSEDF